MEPVPIDLKTIALDRAVCTYERMLLDATIEAVQNGDEAKLALRGLCYAYERALQDRYPYKHMR